MKASTKYFGLAVEP